MLWHRATSSKLMNRLPNTPTKICSEWLKIWENWSYTAINCISCTSYMVLKYFREISQRTASICTSNGQSTKKATQSKTSTRRSSLASSTNNTPILTYSFPFPNTGAMATMWSESPRSSASLNYTSITCAVYWSGATSMKAHFLPLRNT